MASTREVITRSLRRIRVVGLLEEPPSEIMTHGLEVLNDMLSAYEADGLLTETVVITGNISNGSKSITDLNNDANLYNTDRLAVGMLVTGAGVSSRIHTIVTQDEITMTDAATATGTGVSITFSSMPMDDSLTQALVSVLAVRLAEDFGASVGPVLSRDAKQGQAQIDGFFFKVPRTSFDNGIVLTPTRRYYDGNIIG